MEGYFRVLRDDLQGLRFLADEVRKRGITVNFNYTGSPGKDAELARFFETLTSECFEIGGAWYEPFTGLSYEEQKAAMIKMQEEIRAMTGRPMKTFSSKGSALDVNTLRAADELGIRYVFGRGSADCQAAAYRPLGHQVCIIATTNVYFAGEHGTLSDGSMQKRGASAEDFGSLLRKIQRDKITFSLQSQLSGRDSAWWEASKSMLDRPDIRWCDVNTFAFETIELPLSELPIQIDGSDQRR